MSSRISRWNLSSLAMAASRASSRRAICSRWTRSVVRVNSTRQPFSTRAKPRAAADEAEIKAEQEEYEMDDRAVGAQPGAFDNTRPQHTHRDIGEIEIEQNAR